MRDPRRALEYVTRRRGWLPAFVLALTFGCSSEIRFELYNNSGVPITVDNCEGDRLIAAGDRGVIYGCGEAGPALLSNERKWTYAALPGGIAESGYETRLDSWRRITLQVEPGGSVLAIRSDDDPPVRPDYPQPSGFPIRPDGQELLR